MKDMMLKWWIRMEHAAMGRIRETAERYHRDKDGAGVAEYAMALNDCGSSGWIGCWGKRNTKEREPCWQALSYAKVQ